MRCVVVTIIKYAHLAQSDLVDRLDPQQKNEAHFDNSNKIKSSDNISQNNYCKE